MSRLRGLRAWWQTVSRRDTVAARLEEELRFHLEMETAANERRGMEPAAARRRALVAFGAPERFREEVREGWGVRWVEDLWTDLRYAVRSLRRQPGFTLAVLLVLGLGIGATVAAFSAADAVLFAGLPYPDEARLVRLYQENPGGRWGLSVVDYRAVEARARTLSAAGLLEMRSAELTAGGEPERAAVGYATAGVFTALGTGMAAGRAVRPTDEPPGAEPVVVVTHAFAERRLGGVAAAVGKSLQIDGTIHTVVGVLPAGVDRVAAFRGDVWAGLQLEPPARRGPFGKIGVARLAPGASLEHANRELAGISQAIFPDWQASFQDRTARITAMPLHETLVGGTRGLLGLFAAAALLVLLVAVANAANLVLVRAIQRGREVEMRTLLGASRGRLARWLVVEGLVLAVAGGLAGVVLGLGGLRALQRYGPQLPRLDEAALDPRALGFAVAVTLGVGVAVGLVPLLGGLRRGYGTPGRIAGRPATATVGTQRLRRALVVGELALALPLLWITGLLLASFLRLQRVDPGFDPSHVLAMHVSLPEARYPDDEAMAAFWHRLLPRVESLPGVAAAGLANGCPPDDPSWNINNFDLIDHPVPPGGAQPVSPWVSADRSYFATLGVPLLAGRLFGPEDVGAESSRVVVSRSWAERYFPEGGAVGRKMVSGGCTECPATEVIGVVGDVKYQGLGRDSIAVYEQVDAYWPRETYLFVRTAGPPAAAARSLSALLHAADPALALEPPVTLEGRLAASVTQPRHWTALIGGFALTALALAAVGVFGVLAYTVRTRRREIGVRVALGAGRSTIVGDVLRRGLLHALAGAAIGLALALLFGRWLETCLFGITASDPATLATVTLLLLAVSLAASALPALRAAGLDPVRALREE